MATFECSSCGRKIEAAPQCPHCGAEQGAWAEELARIERAIADMKARDVAIGKEQRQIASELQAALFQRDILAHASEERLKQATKPRRVLRRRPTRRPPTAEPGPGPRIPRQGAPRGGGRDRVAPPPPPPGEPPAGPEHPEASPREVQNILLGLGALLLGVAAVVFAAVAISSLDDASRLAILIAATALMLVAPPLVARRGLTSTAETIAAVGLLLVPLDGYALWIIDRVRASGPSGAVFASLTVLVTAIVAGVYARTTGLSVPRFAAVLAVQPVLPLLAYDWITAPVGWALVLTAVAAVDLYLAQLVDQHGRLVVPAWLGKTPGAGDGPADGRRADGPADRLAGGDPARPPSAGTGRPETAPEETDAVHTAEPTHRRPPAPHAAGPATDPGADEPDRARTGRAPAVTSVTFWLRELTWVLHGLAVGIALGYGVAALIRVGTVPTAAQAGVTLLLAAGVGLAGALTFGKAPLPDIGAGVLTLAVIGAVGRVAAVALPGRALLLIGAVIALTGLGVRAVPDKARRGSQLAAAIALVVSGTVVAGGALRAGLAPIRAALPFWHADLSSYPDQLAAAVGTTGWQLAATAFLLTIAAVLSLPVEIRREFAVAGTALTALAVPASFGLGWAAAPWPPVLAAIGIGFVGLSANTNRAALTHALAATVVGVAGAGASVARPGLTAAVLFTLTAVAVLISLAPRVPTAELGRSAGVVADWASGGAAFALPGAVAAAVVAATGAADPALTAATLQHATVPVLAASFLAVCVTLGYAAITQVSQRQISMPLTVGTGLGALAVTAAAFGAPGAGVPDAWVGALILIAAVLLFLAPSIDAGRRADRILDGADFAAAAATASLVGTLARIATILAPAAELAVAALFVFVVAAGARAVRAEWRRGPILGVSLGGAVVALIAGYTALGGGLRVLATPGRLWSANLDEWQFDAGGNSWQVPIALVLLAGATAAILPRPWKYQIAGALVGLATIGTPAALGLPWWSPIVVGTAVATGYGLASVVAIDPRAGLTRAVVAAAVALHAIGASLVRPWTTAAALGVIALVGLVVAALARAVTGVSGGADPDEMPPHLAQIGGAATTGALLALPGALASLAAALHWPAGIVLTSGLAGSTLAVAATALVRRQVPHFLPYATVGIAGGATATAAASLPTDLPTGVFAAAAALLGVLAELVRAATPPPGSADERVRRWSVMLDGTPRRDVFVSRLWGSQSRFNSPSGTAAPHAGRPETPAPRARSLSDTLTAGRWSVSPAMGAMIAGILPTALAVAALAPALAAALVEPYRTLTGIWAGPPPELTSPPAGAVNGTNVLSALLLTIAAALAATGFSNGRPARAIPVILPGAAITLLIAPISLGMGWPNSTMAALTVFTLAMLGLALTPPPPVEERARSLRVARILVFVIGQAAGGAGLAGSLATRQLTLFTLGSAVLVGAVAALAGRTQAARILGWLFASIMAQLFVLTAGLVAGVDPVWTAFGVLGVGAALLLAAATVPRLRRPEATREAATVEWSGYAGALIAGALAYDSPRHIAALLAAWGAVLGVAAARPGRGTGHRRTLFWAAVACEISAWWLLMRIADVALPEAYTLPFAALALLVGVLEVRQRHDVSSWVAYGPALVAAFLPTLVIVLATEAGSLRQVLLLLGGVATLIFGSTRRQQAPVIIGALVTAIATLHLLTAFGPWLVLIPVGIVLLVLGASNESRRRTQERLRALRGMR